MPTSSYRNSDPASIQAMFSRIAHCYDRGNATLSLQMHRIWNRRLVQEVLFWPRPPERLLDLCCGTGEITFTYLRELLKSRFRRQASDIILMDFSADMLHEAERKAAARARGQCSLQFVPGDAQAIPLPNDSMDAIVIAYGIRNVANPSLCLNEVYRVLKPGGRVGILELTRPNNALLRAGHTIYLRTVVPLLSRLVTPDRGAYRYLSQSIEAFMSVDELHHALRMAGFHHSWCKPLMGGIGTLLFGQKGAAFCVSECAHNHFGHHHDCTAITAVPLRKLV